MRRVVTCSLPLAGNGRQTITLNVSLNTATRGTISNIATVGGTTANTNAASLLSFDCGDDHYPAADSCARIDQSNFGCAAKYWHTNLLITDAVVYLSLIIQLGYGDG